MQERVCDAHSATRPKSMSRILSLSMIVFRRWAIVKIVRSAKPLRTSSCAVDNFIRLWLIMWQPQALRQATHIGAAEVAYLDLPVRINVNAARGLILRSKSCQVSLSQRARSRLRAYHQQHLRLPQQRPCHLHA